ncbi:hypothetical protein ACOALA_13415 [Alicyclobacillus acidoterrestris]|uniref:hypothetical protein n=1 Tax=Alicyclobacillus acidoterrestris TaxID=1450 RepID=UPI003F532464
MGVYGNMVITQQGQTLFGKVQTGATLTFTRMQIGSGQLASGQDPTTFTSLIAPIDYFNINSVANSGGTAVVRGIYQNTNLTVSTYTCEIGLYAQDPDAGEILYAYANAGTQGDTIPPYSDGPYSRQFQINTAVGNATNVTANVPSDAYVTVSEVGQPGGVASLDNNGHVPPDQINISTATTTDPGSVLVSASPEEGQQPVAVSTTDPVYENAARKDEDNAFTAKQTFGAGFDVPTGQTGTVEGTLQAGSGGVIHATNADNLGGNAPSYFLAATAQAADSAKLNGQPASYYATASAVSNAQSTANSALSTANAAAQVLSGGKKIQSGSLYIPIGSAGSYSVTFPIAFSSAPVIVNFGGGNTYAPSNITTTGFTTGSSSSGTTIYWIAIGN